MHVLAFVCGFVLFGSVYFQSVSVVQMPRIMIVDGNELPARQIYVYQKVRKSENPYRIRIHMTLVSRKFLIGGGAGP